ncbi:MAG: EscU/YscU/HrcU family type III secretion system export apparatus switch protein [Candidatus Thiodiazotropha lotti]|uniref:Flagellar biosynthetic protein FlhB n=1 Tax=Candidatus Thiodiazotropha lotti TaxID=2792787 RepID=A0A9E4K2X6_9GAMM|nr:EscU/YscU/HrcU family type III secretion system export apparatus switch protein [Candidatus Thiodiazotropha lotti]ODB99253.1 flagellar protein FhlB [Candidatus Thiodiazotropha endoloripes]MCG7921918.1 EscU/YscU/HrcU family type III secretion system export apparatus switch protein [Candidatus Thiodiazotropha lotti]MCG7932821.1 EscU/YscU/HrcU family type III secretion system export apparatus switch protein [Candidatus Thiodiazotropha lotti]MCG7938440.1 EscU/YscU/HrcU family type III secretion 
MNKKDLDSSDLAVALKYDGENTPRLTAKGRGELAEKILALAEEHNIPLHEDVELAALLSQIPLGDEIPQALYRAVAEVIAFAYLLSGKRPPGFEDQ